MTVSFSHLIETPGKGGIFDFDLAVQPSRIDLPLPIANNRIIVNNEPSLSTSISVGDPKEAKGVLDPYSDLKKKIAGEGEK